MPSLQIDQRPVTDVPAAPSADALAHFSALLTYETDCWDVHAARAAGGVTGWLDEGFELAQGAS